MVSHLAIWCTYSQANRVAWEYPYNTVEATIPAHLPPQRVTLVLQHLALCIDHLRQTYCLTSQVGGHLHKPGMPGRRSSTASGAALRRHPQPLHTDDADQHTDEGQLRIVNAQLVEKTGPIGNPRDDPEPIPREI